MRYWKLFASALSLMGVLAAIAQEGSGGCPACIVIQSQQRSDVEVGFAELTVPKGQLSWFTIGSPASDENRFRTFVKTGVTERFDLGVGYSHYGERTTLQMTYQLARQDERVPVSLLAGYGFSSTYRQSQEGFYLRGVRTDGNLSVWRAGSGCATDATLASSPRTIGWIGIPR